MSGQQTFMQEGRTRTGRRAATKKPFAVEGRYDSNLPGTNQWHVWRRYEKRGDAEKAIRTMPSRWALLKAEFRLVAPTPSQ